MTSSRERNRYRRAIQVDPRARQAHRAVLGAYGGGGAAIVAMVIAIVTGLPILLVPLAAAAALFTVTLHAALRQREHLLSDPRRIDTLATSGRHTMSHDMRLLGYEGEEYCDDPDDDPDGAQPLSVDQTQRLRVDRTVVPDHQEMVDRLTGSLPDGPDGR